MGKWRRRCLLGQRSPKENSNNFFSNEIVILMSSLTLVIPCYNEAKSLIKLVPSLLEQSIKYGWKLIFVNDGSSDGTLEILKQFKEKHEFEIINYKRNKGYGAALKSGFKRSNTKFVISFDADGQHKLDDVKDIFGLAIKDDCDLIIGTRRDKGISYRKIGKAIIKILARILLKSKIKDLNSGLKLYKTELAKKYMTICPDTMAFSEVITLVFVYFKHDIIEYQIKVGSRRAGKSTITTYTAFDTLLEIINIIMLFNPLRIFFPLFVIIAIPSVIWASTFVFLGKGLTTGSLFGLVFALLILLLGLIAEQISKLRKEKLTP